MKKRNLFIAGAMSLIVVMILAPLVASAGAPSAPGHDVMAQTGPTATPSDFNWIAFSLARDALSEDLQTRISIVKGYTYEYRAFPDAIATGCTEPEIDEETGAIIELPVAYAGWQLVITLLNGKAYEVRVTNDLAGVIICDEVTVEGVASDNPTVPGGNPGTIARGAMELGAQVPNELSTNAVTALRQAKMNWIKVQAKEGQDWSGFISNAKSQGFKILLSVIGDVNQVLTPAYQDRYAQYVANLARQGADAIEVWNEANISREWPAGQINGTSYVDLLKKAYAAIRAANPNTIVITAGPAPTGFFGATGCAADGCNDDEFYRLIATAGAAQYADCIGVHYNEGVVSPRQSTGDPRDNYPTRYFGSNLARATRYFPGMPMCFTEIGYLSPEGYGTLPPLFAWGQNTSVAEQAQWLAEAAVLSSQLGYVRLFIVFNLNFTSFGADPQGGYGIVRPGGTCPACTELARIQP